MVEIRNLCYINSMSEKTTNKEISLFAYIIDYWR